jgi:hypothetical protein
MAGSNLLHPGVLQAGASQLAGTAMAGHDVYLVGSVLIGHRDPAMIPELLRIHAQAADLP